MLNDERDRTLFCIAAITGILVIPAIVVMTAYIWAKWGAAWVL